MAKNVVAKGGNFSKLVNSYKKVRKEYPSEVIKYFHSFSLHKNSTVLDLGCGTGISTRQIASASNITIGCDNDQKMLKIALESSSKNISYVLGSGGDIPFSDNLFDIVTAFGSFHWISWYEKEPAMKEIKRVLKPNGIFIVVNKTDTNTFTHDAKVIIQKHINGLLPEVRKDYSPEKTLKSHGFQDVIATKFDTVEKFTVAQAMLQLQSMSLWNYVTKSKRTAVIKDLKKMCEIRLKDGLVERNLDVIVISGKNMNK